jgi:hypothetical protein
VGLLRGKFTFVESHCVKAETSQGRNRISKTFDGLASSPRAAAAGRTRRRDFCLDHRKLSI